MPNVTLKTAQVSGTPSDIAWGQAHVFSDMFLIVVLEKKNAQSPTNLAAAGKEFFLHLERKFEETNKKNLDGLREIFSSLNTQEDAVRITSVVVALISGNILYLGCQNGAVLLRRGGLHKTILEATERTVFASGFLEDDDSIVLLTSDLAAPIEGEKTGEMFEATNPEEMAETLSAVLHKEQESERFVGLVAQVKDTMPVGAEEIEREQALPEKEKQSRIASTKRVVMTVFLLLMLLFVASLVLGIGKRQQEQDETRFARARELAVQRYEEGVALSDLNPTLSAKTLGQAREIVEGELVYFTKDGSNQRSQLLELQKKIAEALHVALKIETIEEVPLFFDLALIKEGAKATSVSLFGKRLVVLDREHSALYLVNISTKQAELIGGNIDEVTAEAVGTDFAYVLARDGVERIGFRTKKREGVIDKDEEWGTIGEIVFFAGNLYLLDKDNGAIYRYSGTGSRFGSRRNYLVADTKPDFTGALSMAIDGSIWVLFADGRISKFSLGAAQAFSVSGIDIPLREPAVLFTDDESEHLYILDRGNRRIVVVKKDGTYLSQYRWDGIETVSDLIVSEKEGKILLLVGSKIYGIAL